MARMLTLHPNGNFAMAVQYDVLITSAYQYMTVGNIMMRKMKNVMSISSPLTMYHFVAFIFKMLKIERNETNGVEASTKNVMR